jgi:8-oxo-dGTP pyrophosphatase MutT (NUDIX family)
MGNPWKKISSKIVHKNPWYSVRVDTVVKPNGRKGKYHVVVSKPAVFIVPVNAKKEIVLVGMYRYTTAMYSLEVPAGGSDGQPPLVAAKRELQEETGLVAKKWRKLGKIQVANGIMSERSYCFLATGLTQTNHHEQKEEGIDQMVVASFPEVFKMIRSGDITDGLSIAAITMAAIELGLLPTISH